MREEVGTSKHLLSLPGRLFLEGLRQDQLAQVKSSGQSGEGRVVVPLEEEREALLEGRRPGSSWRRPQGGPFSHGNPCKLEAPLLSPFPNSLLSASFATVKAAFWILLSNEKRDVSA